MKKKYISPKAVNVQLVSSRAILIGSPTLFMQANPYDEKSWDIDGYAD